MTKRQRNAMQRYVDELRPLMGLEDWNVDVLDEPLDSEGESLAWMETVFGRKQGFLAVRPDLFHAEREFIRHIVAHELTHCHFGAAQQNVFVDLGDWMPREMHAVFSQCFRQNLEFAVDAVAGAIAPRLPLPPFPRA